MPIIFIVFLFIGGHVPGAFFELDNAEKLVKKYVEDETRKKETLTIVKDYFDIVKDLRKEQKDVLKELKDVSAVRTTTEEEMKGIIQSLSEVEQKAMKSWMELRLKIPTVITKDEFDQIVEAGTMDNKKADKEIQKAKQKRDESLLSLKNVIKETITNEDKLNNVLKDFELYENALNGNFEMHEKINLDVIKDYGASEEELQNPRNEIAASNQSVLSAYQTFFFQLVEQTTEDEWVNINKKVIQLFE